jgi:luciferase-like monooxygenase
MTFMRLVQAVLTASLVVATTASAGDIDLPKRTTPIPQTTNGVPHVQIGIEPVPTISSELLDRVAKFPGVDIRPTVVSLPGALGFWISEDFPLSRPEAIAGGREFAHLHPDGSLHASLPADLAAMAAQHGWAVAHPWADQRPGWEGFSMIFTPQNRDELEVVASLVAHSYEFVTGRSAAAD